MLDDFIEIAMEYADKLIQDGRAQPRERSNISSDFIAGVRVGLEAAANKADSLCHEAQHKLPGPHMSWCASSDIRALLPNDAANEVCKPGDGR